MAPARSQKQQKRSFHPGRRQNNVSAIDRVAGDPSTLPPPGQSPMMSHSASPSANESSGMRFADLSRDIHPTLLKTITEDLKFDSMTPVQAATIYELLHNRVDCLAQAKTGTGKTIAFLLPAISTLLQRQGRGISLLVISPTRELALQIAKEASALLARFPQYKVQTAIGGTNKDREERNILAGCDILVATPGRLHDHLGDDRIVQKFSTLDTLVLDEADRLLDMGFVNELKKIIACLPDKVKSNRQGMLFSATIADHVSKFASLALSPGYKFISTIPAGEINTHEHVEQQLITVPAFKDVLPAAVGAMRRKIMVDGAANFKAIVFAPTAAQADWYALTLSRMQGFPPVSTLHSRLSQSKRTNVSNDFKTASSAILVATDVVARGMDFPNVSTVIQLGMPSDKESYIHRLGRTARAGRDGSGIFIIAEAESFFPKYRLKEIKFIPTEANITEEDQKLVQSIAAQADTQGKTYQAWLGFYNSHLKSMGWTQERLVEEGNRYAIEGMCSGGVPEIQKQTVGKMGLKGVRGLNIIANLPRPDQPRGPGSGGRQPQKKPTQPGFEASRKRKNR